MRWQLLLFLVVALLVLATPATAQTQYASIEVFAARRRACEVRFQACMLAASESVCLHTCNARLADRAGMVVKLFAFVPMRSDPVPRGVLGGAVRANPFFGL